MAATVSTPVSAHPPSVWKSDGHASLSPPHVRQPYTPPPRTGEDEDIEDDGSLLPQLQDSNGGIGDETDTKVYSTDALDGLAICASPGDHAHTARRKRFGGHIPKSMSGASTLASMLRKGIVDHQLGLSLNMVLLVAMSWCVFPSLRHDLEALFLLSYKSTLDDGQVMYGQGPRDLHLVCACIVVFTGLRAFMLEHVLTPLAGLWGIQSSRMRTRFAEQSYLLLYYLVYWNWGLYILIQETPQLSNHGDSSISSMFSNLLQSFFTGFPRLFLGPQMKVYYLTQLAFWIQQIVVVHLEEKRKDHYQMLTHHFVTVGLMSMSYGFRQWRVGNAVLVCMDIIEIIFPSAKILKYLGLQAACDAAFGLFVVMWLIARHGCYLTICYSVYLHLGGTTMPYGTYSLTQPAAYRLNDTRGITGLSLSPTGSQELLRNMYQPFFDAQAETVSFNWKVRWTFLGLLLGLQCITIMWFAMIIRVVIRVLRGEEAADTRSDDEGEADEEPEPEVSDLPPVQPSKPSSIPFTAPSETPRFIEVETNSTEYVRRTPSSSGGSAKRSRKGHTFASGLHLGEHKEILNRIGCLSEEQLAREREKKGDR